MKHLLSLLLLLSATFSAFAQPDATFELGPEIKMENRTGFIKHVFSDETGHYVLTGKFKGFYLFVPALGNMSMTPTLEKYDREFKKEFSKTYTATDEDDTFYENFVYIKGGFMNCYSKWNKKTDKLTYYVQPVGFDGKPGAAQKVMDVKMKNRASAPDATWSVSEDTTVLLLAVVLDGKNAERQQVEIAAISADGTILYDKPVTMPYKEKDMTVQQWAVASDGDAYMSARVRQPDAGKAKDGKKKPPFRFEIVRYDNESDENSTYKIDLGSNVPQNVHLRVDKDGNLNCLGFYYQAASLINFHGIEGVYFMRIDGSSGEIVFNKIKQFKAEQFDDVKGGSDKKDGSTELSSNYRFRNFFVQPDGSMTVLAEVYWFTTYQDRNGNIHYRYHYDDILAFHISSDNEISWATNIRKRQAMTDNTFPLGFSAMQHDNKIFIFYNDTEKNATKSLTEKPKPITQFGKAVTTMVVVETDGEATRNVLTSAKQQKMILIPRDCIQHSENEMFLRAVRPKFLAKSAFRYGTLRIND